jgi:predicted transcriptional regulator
LPDEKAADFYYKRIPMSRKIPKPTDAELEILQILWAKGPSTVRTVNELLNKKREVGYTTTLKLMQIMADKGLAKRNTDSRTHIYEAGVEETDTQNRLLQKFVDNTFRGSAMKMVMQALGNHNASQEELEKIKALIEQIEDQNKEDQ